MFYNFLNYRNCNVSSMDRLTEGMFPRCFTFLLPMCPRSSREFSPIAHLVFDAEGEDPPRTAQLVGRFHGHASGVVSASFVTETGEHSGLRDPVGSWGTLWEVKKCARYARYDGYVMVIWGSNGRESI